MVGPLDPGDDRDPQLLAGAPAAAVEDVLLQQAEERLHRGIVTGGADPTAGVLGSWAHKDFADLVTGDKNLVPPDSDDAIRSETSFDSSGLEVRSGTSGSIRPDIVLVRESVDRAGNPVEQVVQVLDLKTGNARITGTWAGKAATWLDIDPDRTTTIRPEHLRVVW